jgi:serine protease Do
MSDNPYLNNSNEQETSSTYNQINSQNSENKDQKNIPKNLSKNTSEMVSKSSKKSSFGFVVFTILLLFFSLVFSLSGGFVGYKLAKNQEQVSSTNTTSPKNSDNFLRNFGISGNETIKSVQEESAVIDVATKNTSAVISIVISKQVNNLGNLFGNPQKNQSDNEKIGAGTGFIVSKDGFVITNRHVVNDVNATYTAVFSDSKTQDIKVLARDSVLDIAILKLENKDLNNNLKDFEFVTLGDSDKIKIGQNAIAIGNSLGEFGNTVSKGIVSGLGRNITATDGQGVTDTLEDIIQTDASINPGNSGGPLLNIDGNVIGINVAKAQSGENIGFALPINVVKPILESVITTGKIQRPFLGIRYIAINPDFAKKNNLSVDYGALITGDDKNLAITKNGPADKAGLKINDIILEINNQKIDQNTEIRKFIQKFRVGDKIILKVLRNNQQLEINMTLENFPS